MFSFLFTRLMTPALFLLAIDMGLSRGDEAEQKAPTEAISVQETRQSIERGLTFLEKDALAWRKEHRCATCHHGTMTVWALSEAKSRGYAVKPETLADVTEWTKERLKDIDKPRDTRPGWRMVNTIALYLAMMAQAVPRQEAVPADELRRIAGHLVRHQEADGSWAWSSAPPGNRPPPHFESDEVATLLGYMALGPQVPADSKGPSEARESRERAAAWLRECEPTDTTQAVGLRLLVKVRAGESVDALRPEIDRLLGRQNNDGGWGQLRDLPSDAYATGQALYLLGQAGVPPGRAEVRRGVDFLIARQRPDGSWPMKSRAHPGATPYTNPVPITYFGSAWATLGLLRSVRPPVEAGSIPGRPGGRIMTADVASSLLESRNDRAFVFLSKHVSAVNRTVRALLALGLGLPLSAAHPQITPTTPAERYGAMLKESQALYDAAPKQFAASAPKGGTPSDAERDRQPDHGRSDPRCTGSTTPALYAIGAMSLLCTLLLWFGLPGRLRQPACVASV